MPTLERSPLSTVMEEVSGEGLHHGPGASWKPLADQQATFVVVDRTEDVEKRAVEVAAEQVRHLSNTNGFFGRIGLRLREHGWRQQYRSEAQKLITKHENTNLAFDQVAYKGTLTAADPDHGREEFERSGQAQAEAVLTQHRAGIHFTGQRRGEDTISLNPNEPDMAPGLAAVRRKLRESLTTRVLAPVMEGTMV